MLRRLLTTLPLALVLAACSGSDPDTTADAADTLTRAQKDSAVARSGLPGAGAVGRAQQAVERSQSRAQQHDTAGRE